MQTTSYYFVPQVEIGSKNHEVVPTPLIVQISGLRNGGVNKLLGSLAKRNLVARVQNTKFDERADDGYRLTYGGYDYLAMHVYIVADAEGNELVLKLHRLGRISFRSIKEKRDYLGKRKSASWMYMSRLAAQKEWAFMKVLHDHNFPVPKPVDQARHCILMEAIDAYPLRQIADIPSPGKLYSTLMDIIVRFARAGLIHGDYNEFNILICRDSGKPVVIDFPQMVSTSHENAEWYFNRDVECIRTFFRRRFKYESTLYPRFKSIRNGKDEEGGAFQLDVVVAASGFAKKDQKILEEYMESIKAEEPREGSDRLSSEDEEEEVESDGEDSQKESDNEARDSPGLLQIRGDESVEMEGTSAPARDPEPGQEEGSPPSRPSSRFSQLSRSPPRSRSPSPDTLAKMTAAMSLRDVDVRGKVATDLAKRARQQKKYHGQRSVQRAGRPHGSKAKQDQRVRLDSDGFW
ncbi:hypothetical protein ID866_2131 [Astraeus odoratus]|nr:hypothetical protein ID866_2131 [Astraeus odoratus]